VSEHVDYRFEMRPTWDVSCRVYAQSSVDPSVLVGAETTIWRYVTILEGCIIGARCMIADCVSIGRGVIIGDETRIQHGTAIPDHAVVGQRVFIGSNVSMTDVAHPNLRDKTTEEHRPPVIEDDVSIGCNVSLSPGIVIGRGAEIGHGSVVTKDVPAGWIMAGNPARVRRRSSRLLAINEAGELVG
jgi:acetyltransferase-like isoleucine patch superfamily enzyme